MKLLRALVAVATYLTFGAINPAAAGPIGGADIIPTTSIGYCVECFFPRVWLITEITDGITDESLANPGSPYNGFAGTTGAVGTIHLDLVGTYNLTSFLLWNDINVVHEGVETFRLDFFDDVGDS